MITFQNQQPQLDRTDTSGACNAPTRGARIARALLAGACLSAAAMGQSMNSASTGVNAPSNRLGPVNPPPHANLGAGLTTYGGAHLVKELDPAFVGWGFDWDEVNGQFVYRHQVFTLSAPLGTSSPQVSNGLHLETYVDSQHSFDSYSTEATLGSTVGAVKLSASISSTSTSASAAMGSGLGLVEQTQWAPKIAPLGDPTIVHLTPEALAVLAIPGQFARDQAWKAHFGRFIAIGYNLEASITLKANASSFSSSHSTEDHFKFTASYGTTSGGLSVGSFAASALGRQTLVLDWDYHGGTIPAITLPSSLDMFDSSAQSALATTFHDSVTGANSAAMTGLFLLPAGAFAGITLADDIAGDGVILTEVAGTTKQAMKVYNQAFRWMYPYTKYAFLAYHTLPGQTTNCAAALDSARANLALQFDELWAALKLYMADGNQGVQAYRDALLVERDDVNDAAQALQDVLTQIQQMAAALPPMSVELHWSWSALGGGHCYWTWVPFRVVIDNAGIFNDDFSPTSLTNWITYRGRNSAGFVDAATAILGEQNECNNLFYTKYFASTGPDAHMASPFLLSHQVYLNGPSAGLSRIEFSFNAECYANGNESPFTITDDLNRFRTITADLDNPNP